MTLKIEAGKFYVDANGIKTGPMAAYEWPDRSQERAFIVAHGDGDGRIWSEAGEYSGRLGKGADLIAEWTDEPAPVKEVGTLREIGAQVGDVVECITEPDGDMIGAHMTINDQTYAIANDGTCFCPEYDEQFGRTYRIIRRASDAQTAPAGPVITETVKRIVPGVYGRLFIADQDEKDKGKLVKLKLADRGGKHHHNACHYMNAEELRDLASHALELADALDGGAK